MHLAPTARVRALLAALVVALCLTSLSALPASAQVPSDTMYGWGYNTQGELGDGTGTDRTRPVEVLLPDGVTITKADGGAYHTLALTSDGRILAWGGNSFGALGDGSTSIRQTPVWTELPDGVTITDISAGGQFSMALTSDGRVLAWGLGRFLGTGSMANELTPVEVPLPAGLTFTKIVAGGNHSMALASDGRLFSWGLNGYGQLGNGTTTESLTPIEVDLPAGVTITQIAVSNSSSFALTSDGRILAWGSNERGTLGDGTTTNRTRPVETLLPDGVTATDVDGGLHGVAATSDGRVFAWGANHEGQVGDGTTTDRLTPVPITFPAGTFITDIAASQGGHSMALSSDGRVFTWGANNYGQIGDGTRNDRLTPYHVLLPAGVTISAIGIGNWHSLALVEGEASSATTLTATPETAVAGEPVTLTATVTCDNGTPTGEVTYYRDGRPIGTAALNGQGTATLTVSDLAPGQYEITARYAGDGNCPPSESAPVTVTVAKSPSTAGLVADPAEAFSGDTVTFTTTVTCNVAPTGTVTFYEGDTAVGTGQVGADGTATLTTDDLPPGTHHVTARYPGDGNCLGTSSEAVTVTIAERASTTTLTASPTTVAPGEPVDLSATTTCNSGTPTGEVVFYDGDTAIGTAGLGADGTARLTTTGLGLGAHEITAHYQGDGNCPPSVSEPVVEIVEEAPHPSLDLTKRADSNGPFQVGDTAAYTYTATNTGNTTLDDVTVTDSRIASVTCDDTSLAPGRSTTCHGTYTITESSITPCHPAGDDCALTNLAQATAFEPTGQEVASEQATATVTVRKPAPGLALTKRAVSDGPFQIGDTVQYTYTATNTGNTTLDDVTVTDSRITHVSCGATGLIPGRSTTCHGTYTITESSITPCHPAGDDCALTNLAQATAFEPTGQEVGSEQATATVTVQKPTPSATGLTLTKKVASKGPFRVGDKVQYTYTVTDTGDTDLDDVTVSDNRITTVTCDDTSLTPGQSTTCHGTYTVTEASVTPCEKAGERGGDPDKGGDGATPCTVTNTATAAATAPNDDRVTSNKATATITVRVGEEKPCKKHFGCHK
ncbi:Ig-like domain repeat protein [Streptomyces sp. NPDC057499]|uniref:RCC1 domain-containing protein n=1 Tax=Streptomyces sp. NPDC057499 TaxID=3346150 RepID=UPI0036B96C43